MTESVSFTLLSHSDVNKRIEERKKDFIMFKIEVFFIIIFGYGIIQWCNSHKIVETNEIDPDNESFEINDLSFTQGSNVLETIYASQTVGKSHRYHFIAGNRKTGRYF